MTFRSTYFTILAICLLLTYSHSQNEIKKIDGLIQGKNLNQSLKIIDSVGKIILKNDPELYIPINDLTVALGKKFENDSVIAKAYWTRSRYLRKRGEFDQAEKYLNDAGELFKQYHKPEWEITILADMGTIYMIRGLHEGALIRFMEAIKIAEDSKFTKQIGRIYANTGNVYLAREDYDKAVEFYKKAYDHFELTKDTMNAALTLDNLGLVHGKKKRYEVALQYHFKALELIERSNDKTYAAESYINIGTIYIATNELNKAFEFLKKAELIYSPMNSKVGLTTVYINLGEIYIKQNKFNDAKNILNKGYEIAKEIESYDHMKTYAQNLSQAYEGLKQFDKALIFHKVYSDLKDTILNIESTEQINELTERFESKQKQQEIDLLTKDKALADSNMKQSRILTGFLIGGILLTVILLTTVFYRYRDKKKANILLEEKNNAINEQKKLIEEKQSEIIDSINYAKKLQGAILLSEDDLKKQFTDIFILYKPKDIVSGDFYWFSESEHNKILAVADCTGHGVPGGFMSMLGYESLQDVALRKEIATTSQALISLDRKITQSLNKSDRTFRDGMDIALIAIDKKHNTLQYSGANRPLIQIRDGELIEHKPDKQAIGGNIDNTDKSYNTKQISCEKGDVFYMFTDGYADQFGGKNEKKFKYKNLLKALIDNHQLPLSQQKIALNNIYMEWKGNLEQLDDVCLIGFKI